MCLTQARLFSMSSNITATPRSTTPILDREAPLPALAAPGSGHHYVIGRWLGLIIVFSATFVFWDPSYGPAVRKQFPELLPDEWTASGIASLLLMAPVIGYAVISVHEIGHVLGGLCAGFRFNALRIGPLLIHRGFRISRCREPGAWLGGEARMIPNSGGRPALRALALVSAGPAANILSACTCSCYHRRAWPRGCSPSSRRWEVCPALSPIGLARLSRTERESGCCSGIGGRANDGWHC